MATSCVPETIDEVLWSLSTRSGSSDGFLQMAVAFVLVNATDSPWTELPLPEVPEPAEVKARATLAQHGWHTAQITSEQIRISEPRASANVRMEQARSQICP
eukprot:479050-Amphidinium_carterae.1